MKGAGIVAGGFVLLLVSLGWAYIQGSIIVSGETQTIVRADIVNSVRAQRLTALPGGLFFAFPRTEGGIRVVCRDGTTREAGYATPGLHTHLTAVNDGACVALRND